MILEILQTYLITVVLNSISFSDIGQIARSCQVLAGNSDETSLKEQLVCCPLLNV